MIVALILGLVLVAIPLYLWRRPRADSISVGNGSGETPVLPAVTAAAVAPEEKLVVGEAKILSCSEPKKGSPAPCDRAPELESALSKAVEETASCVPRDAGGGTIVYVAEIAVKKKTVAVTTPKDGRTLKNAKVASSCEKAMKSKLSLLPFDSMKLEHARYKLSVTATYPGSVKP